MHPCVCVCVCVCFDEHWSGFLPNRQDPSARPTTNKNYSLTLAELLDYLTPSAGGGGRTGIQVQLHVDWPNSYFSNLTRSKAPWFLADDRGGSFFRIFKTVTSQELVLGEAVEIDYN